MTTQARGLIRDQNLSVHFDGVKNNVSKAQENGGGLGGRKALNDISNSGRPSGLNSTKRHISKNVISIGEEIGSSKPISSFGSKRNVSKAPEKGRKALSDLTNSGKPYVQQSSNDSRKKLGTVVEEQILSHNISGEQLLHNHQECIKAQQQKGIDIDYFLHSVGLENDNTLQLASPRVSLQSSKLKADSPPKYFEIEEMSEFLCLDQCQVKNTSLPSGQASPCESPKSPKPCEMWKDYDFTSFTLTKSPNH